MNENGTEGPMQRQATAALESPPVDIEEAFRAHHDRVFRVAYRVTGSAGDAEDVLQTVFLRLLRKGRTAGSIGNLEAYLCRAAVNAALDVVRDRGAKTVPLADIEPKLAEDARFRPDRRHAAAELRDWLRSAMATLSPKAAEMFALRYFEGYGNAEIAGMTGVSPADVAVTLHRTRSRLQSEMRSYLGDKP